MHVVTCPHCGRRSRTPRAVHEEKIECGCGQVFVATSVEAGAPAAPAPTGPAAPAPAALRPVSHKSFNLHARSKSPLPIIVVVGGLMALFMVAIVAWYFHAYPYREFRDEETGKMIFGDRMTQSEFDRRVEEYQQKQTAGRRPVARPGARRDSGDYMTDSELRRAVTGGAQSDPTGIGNPSRFLHGRFPDLTVIMDPKSPDAGDVGVGGHLLGYLRNGRSVPLRSATVNVYVLDTDNVWRGPLVAQCDYVPAGYTIRFAVEFKSLAKDQIQDARGEVTAVTPAGPDKVCREVDGSAFSRKATDQRIILTGRAANTTQQLITDVMILCDFYNSDGVRVGSATAAMKDVKQLSPKQSEYFTIEFDWTTTDEAAHERIPEFRMRLWARKPK